MRNLLLVSAGGTIDAKEYRDGKVLSFRGYPTINATLLRHGFVDCGHTYINLPPKDSLDMEEGDRAKIANLCQATTCSRVLITHGTDTVINTARAVADRELQKTIVFVGAMIPALQAGSDAEFNIGFALAAVQMLPVGVWIAMSGQAFPWDQCRKVGQRFVPK